MCPFQCGKDCYIFKKKYVRVLYMSFHSRVVFCAPMPTGPRTPDFGSCSMSYSLQTARGRYSGLLGPVYHPTGMSADESYLYGPPRQVEHVWAKIPQFHRRLVGWAGATEPPAHNKSMRM